jgi:hypothetical protein
MSRARNLSSILGTSGSLNVTPTAVSDQINTSTGYFDLPSGTTAQRPGSPGTGMTRFNTSTSVAEFYNGSGWVGIGLKDGTTSSQAASSAAAIKAVNPSVQSGVYWLQINGVNSSIPFQCYCDFSINGGIGYAMIVNQYFTGYEEGPSFTTMAGGISGTAGYDSEYSISPNAVLANYGLTKLAVFARTNNGTGTAGIQSASTYRWVAFTGPSAAQYNNIFNNRYDNTQFTGSFVTADGNSGTAYFPNSHSGGGGVTQITNGTTVNNYILYEYKPQGGSDPNHYWMVANGRDGDNYFAINSTYGSNSGNVLYNRWGGVLIH